jgi:hypothetical protein
MKPLDVNNIGEPMRIAMPATIPRSAPIRRRSLVILTEGAIIRSSLLLPRRLLAA